MMTIQAGEFWVAQIPFTNGVRELHRMIDPVFMSFP